MSPFFISIYRFLSCHRRAFFLVLFLITLLLAWLASSIKLREDVGDFMPTSAETERVNFVDNNIALAEKIIISLSNSDTTLDATGGNLYQWADVLVDSIMAKAGDHISNILYVVDDEQTVEVMNFVIQNLPYYLTESDYQRIDTLLTPEKIRATLVNNRGLLISPTGYLLKSILPYDPLMLSSNALQRFSELQVDNTYNIDNGHILSKDKKSLMIFVSSKYPVSETGNNKVLVKALRQCYSDIVNLSGNSILLSSFGAAEVGVTNATQIKRDSFFSIAVSLCLIIIVLGLFFKKPAPLYMIMIPVIFGGLFAIALLFILKETISAIAIGAGSAIFGIAINYSLHFFVHYKDTNDIETTIKDLSSPMITGSITTIGAFISLMMVSSNSLHDFGLFAAFTLIGSLVFVLIAVPQILSRSRERAAQRAACKTKVESSTSSIAVEGGDNRSGMATISSSDSSADTTTNNQVSGEVKNIWERLADYRPENKKYMIAVTVIITIILSLFSGKVKFDSDLNNINYMTDEQRESFNELSGFTTLSRQTNYLVSEGETPYEALREFERSKTIIDSLVTAGQVKGYTSVGAGLLSDSLQAKRIARWNEFWETRREPVKASIERYAKEAGFNSSSFAPFYSMIDSSFAIAPYDHFKLFSEKLFSDMIINTATRAMIVTMVHSMPGVEVDPTTFIPDNSNTFLYDRKNFADSLVGSLMTDFNKVLWMCSLIVLVFLTISFGRLELSLISFTPMAISWVWILGIMAITDINFNVVNIILASFIFGLGDDYSIFITEGLMQDYSRKTKLLNSYKTAVLLSAITMFIGIGTLVFAKHPAMKSLGLVTIIGMISVVLVSYIVAPFLFNALVKKKGEYRTVPITFKKLLQTIYSFVGFMFFSLMLTLTGFWLLTIHKPTKANKLKYHKYLHWIIRHVTYMIPGVKANIINTVGETFDKPAVMICNHQAHIDLAYMMLLSPKVIILTNEWVWNSPFYGRIIKYADFYPVANGIENSVDKLATLVADGYSILVFPEGTRSADCTIGRFHKGAFYLAEQLNLDILPILIHGMGHCLPKKEFLLRQGTCSVKIFNRIKPGDTSLGTGYAERAKEFRKFYQQEYDRLAHEIETPEYHIDKVYHNYIYKGPLVELEARKILKNEAIIKIINSLPDTGSILIKNVGYGVFALLTALTKKGVTVTAIECDEEKRLLAENCISRPANLLYSAQLPEGRQERDFDAVIFAP